MSASEEAAQGATAAPAPEPTAAENEAPSTSTLPPTPTVSGTPGLSAPLIIGLAVVDFNHQVGPQVEKTFPKELAEDEELVANLPFYALPDGSHLSDEDFCYFHLFAPKTLPEATIFGISCNRQIAAAALTKKGVEVTRSTVQKAVVVLARQPVFGPIREKLGIVTRAYFAQGDLSDTVILTEFLSTLEAGLRQGLGQSLKEVTAAAADDSQESPLPAAPVPEEALADSDGTMSMGTSLRQFIYDWRFKTLVLVKLLLLQRRIMFFGYPIERLCTYQYSLVSLLPGLLVRLEDCGSASLKSSQAPRPKADSVKMSDKQSLLRYMGYPLPVFGDDALFHPYLPLQSIDALKAGSWLVGTSNGVFRSQKDCRIDVVVNLEHTSLEFPESTAALKLQNIVALTPEDRKWMDEVVSTVTETWDPENPGRPTTLQFQGSDDYLRMKFQSYISSLLSAMKASDEKSPAAGRIDAAALAPFGAEFVKTFKQTQAYASWDSWTDDSLWSLVPPKHPCEGKVSAIGDVGLRLTAGLHDLKLEENSRPAREAIGKGLTAGSAALQAGGANLYRYASAARTDIGKQIPPNVQQSATDAAQAAGAAASAAAAGARTALGNFGSFLSAKRSEWAATGRLPSFGSPAAQTSPTFNGPPASSATPLATPAAPLEIRAVPPPPPKPSDE